MINVTCGAGGAGPAWTGASPRAVRAWSGWWCGSSPGCA